MKNINVIFFQLFTFNYHDAIAQKNGCFLLFLMYSIHIYVNLILFELLNKTWFLEKILRVVPTKIGWQFSNFQISQNYVYKGFSAWETGIWSPFYDYYNIKPKRIVVIILLCWKVRAGHTDSLVRSCTTVDVCYYFVLLCTPSLYY